MSYMREPHYIYENTNGYFYLDGKELPVWIVDMFVVMRFAELLKEKKVKKIARRAVKLYSGNIGCEELCLLQKVKTWLDQVEEEIKK